MSIVTIRPYVEADAPELLQAVAESFADIAPWMVWCRKDYSLETALGWIRGTIVGHEAKSFFEFGVFDAEGTFAGACGVNHVNHVDRFANLAYWIRTSRSHRGIAPAAALAVADWAFKNTELNRLEIVVAVGNVRSHRVAAKVGARREAVLGQRMMVDGKPRDAVMYALLRSDNATQGDGVA